jgi:hypothetical protein
MRLYKFYVRYALGPFKADVQDTVVKAESPAGAKDMVRAKYPGVDIYWLDVEIMEEA